MEKQKTSHDHCCSYGCTCGTCGGRRRKIIGIIILIIAIGAILFAVAAAENTRLHQENVAVSPQSQGPSAASAMYPSPYNPNNNAKQFTLPQDASKSGEILMQVANADTVSQDISAVASQHGGTVYATYSAHAPGDGVRNGFVVVQVDESQFDATYAALESLGTSIIQESTKTIPRYGYAVPMNSAAGQGGQTTETTPPVPTDQNAPVPPTSTLTPTPATAVSNNARAKGEVAAQPAIVVAPMLPPIYSANKGYIKVNFVESGKNVYASGRTYGTMPFFVGYGGMGLRENIWIVLAIKAIAVIMLLFILFILLARFVNHMRRRRGDRKKHTIHIVQQQAKSRPRVVRIAKKK